MKKMILIFLFMIASSAYSKTVQQAFGEFYNSSQINSRLCGVNTQKFIQYLKDEKVSYDKAYVVSIHEDVGALNHFDARWGSRHQYVNGETFQRSNWYFHVFAVIDGIAYDFSQQGKKTEPLEQYLERAYYPKSKTETIFFLGKFTKEKARAKYQNIKMQIFNAEEYRSNMGPARHVGVFNELFNL